MAVNTQRFGIPDENIAPQVVPSVGGQRRTFARLLAIEWAFLVISVVNILSTLGLTSYRLYVVIHTNKDATLAENADFVFCILIIVNSCFCVFYVIHGLLKEREFEIYAYMAAIIIVLLYCILEYSIDVKGRNDIKLGRLIVASILAPVNLIFAGLVAREFGWLQFRIVGASEALQKMFTEVCRFASFLRFDFQIAVSMVILVLRSGKLYEKIILGIGLPVTFIWMVAGLVLVRKEWKWAIWPFAIVGLLEPAYICFKLYMVYISLLDETDLNNDQIFIEYAILSAGALSLLVHSLVYFELYMVSKNFQKGLRERAFDTREISEQTSLLRSGRSVGRSSRC